MSSFALPRLRTRRRPRKPLPPNWRSLLAWIALFLTIAATDVAVAVADPPAVGPLVSAAAMLTMVWGEARHWKAGGFDPDAPAECFAPGAVAALVGLVLTLLGL